MSLLGTAVPPHSTACPILSCPFVLLLSADHPIQRHTALAPHVCRRQDFSTIHRALLMHSARVCRCLSSSQTSACHRPHISDRNAECMQGTKLPTLGGWPHVSAEHQLAERPQCQHSSPTPLFSLSLSSPLPLVLVVNLYACLLDLVSI